ncbi:Hypothetical protein D9617_10g074090 [Elsinoe fawcettii]|nr:Hypothetical protein D9617_10g074090 [Elsinoe fawcettii]
MAPVRKNDRARMRAKATPKSVNSAVQNNFSSTTEEHDVVDNLDASDFPSFAANKKDKQRMRHSALLHRIAKTAPGSKVKKRRRPSKKLAADLDGLLGALPDVEAQVSTGDGDEDEWEGISGDEEDTSIGLRGELSQIANIRKPKRKTTSAPKMEMKSIKSRPGAMKRKANLERSEKDRFARNMAQMAPSTQNTDIASADRWSSLRSFIGQTMQQSPLFKAGT